MKLLILGAGGQAKVVAAAAMACGYELLAFIDDDPRKWGTELLGVPVAGPTAKAGHSGAGLLVQGAVVTRDVAAHSTVVVPARPLRVANTASDGRRVV